MAECMAIKFAKTKKLMKGDDFNKENLQYFYCELKPGFQDLDIIFMKEMEKRGFILVATNEIVRTKKFNEVFYSDLIGRKDRVTGEDIMIGLNEYMCGNQNRKDTGEPATAPTKGFIFYGNIDDARKFQGKTVNPAEDTFRGVYGIGDITQNVLHCSDKDMSKEGVPNAIKEASMSFLYADKFDALVKNTRVMTRQKGRYNEFVMIANQSFLKLEQNISQDQVEK